MSIHLRTPEYVCKNCQTPFMAYSKSLECPKCGTMENSDRDVKSYNFVNDQVWSMLYHMEKYKKFTPGAWYTGCYCDWLQILIYRIFDYVYNNPESSLEEKLKGIKMYDGEGNEFINDKYIHDLFFTIDKQLKITLEEQKIIKKNNRLVNRIKRFFHINI